MTWRPIRLTDLRVGLAIRLGKFDDTIFNGVVVLAYDEKERKVTIARPQAYAGIWSARNPYLNAEVWDTSIYQILIDDNEVWENGLGELLCFNLS